MSSPSTPSLLEAAIKDIVEAARHRQPLDSVRTVLREYTERFHALGKLVDERAQDEVLLHASPHLTIYHITLSAGVQYPPHNHLMHALVGIYRGAEANLTYSVHEGRVGSATRQDICAPAVVHMEPDTVHAVANMGRTRSGALHVYLGNLPGKRRQLWSPDSTGAEPFDNERYLAGARPLKAPPGGDGGRATTG